MHKFIYGRTGVDTANFVNAPDKFVSKNTHCEFNVAEAIKLLDAAGWKPGADGVREKDGKKLHAVYQTSINAPRQKTQEIVKQACQKAGIDDRDQVGHGFGLLLLRRRQSRHVYSFLHRPADVHDDDDAAGSGRVHAPVPVGRNRDQGEQVAGPQHHTLAATPTTTSCMTRATTNSIRSSGRRCSSR